jgi:hypothetical protein
LPHLTDDGLLHNETTPNVPKESPVREEEIRGPSPTHFSSSDISSNRSAAGSDASWAIVASRSSSAVFPQTQEDIARPPVHANVIGSRFENTGELSNSVDAAPTANEKSSIVADLAQKVSTDSLVFINEVICKYLFLISVYTNI